MYHAVGANSTHIGIEQIGFASFSLKTWYLRRRQLKKVAKLIAWISVKHGIPIVRSTGHGISLHSDWEAGGHHDPGKNYPVGRVLKWAEAYKKNGW
jgi:N-acetyl-anhydromuramyl-L-alanine amidase AmpD